MISAKDEVVLSVYVIVLCVLFFLMGLCVGKLEGFRIARRMFEPHLDYLYAQFLEMREIAIALFKQTRDEDEADWWKNGKKRDDA